MEVEGRKACLFPPRPLHTPWPAIAAATTKQLRPAACLEQCPGLWRLWRDTRGAGSIK